MSDRSEFRNEFTDKPDRKVRKGEWPAMAPGSHACGSECLVRSHG